MDSSFVLTLPKSWAWIVRWILTAPVENEVGMRSAMVAIFLSALGLRVCGHQGV